MKLPVVSAIGLLAMSLFLGVQLPATAQAIGTDEFSTAAGSCNNLTVFLIHRKNLDRKGQTAGSKNFLTLSEALAQKKLVINETGDVNKLTIQNFGERTVFMQGGDIIKGGRQDRALQSDLILPPKSKLTEINVFCVEHGRWSQRGQESDKGFATSYEALPSTELKMSALAKKDQSDVWSNVEKFQGMVSGRLQTDATAKASPTSLQLTLENKKIRDAAQQYVDKLGKVIEGKNDVVGYALSINGTITSSDVYDSPDLFKKMWHKQLSAAATEAFMKQGQQHVPAAAPSATALTAQLQSRDSHSQTRTESAGTADVETDESPQSVVLKTTDGKGHIYHRSYINKSAL